MKSRYFVFNDKQEQKEIIDKHSQWNQEREAQLASLREEFGLIGFVFGSQGRPQYFLKELGSEYNPDLFDVGRINRTGNDLMTLEPKTFEILDRCTECDIKTLLDVAARHLPFRPHIHMPAEPNAEVKQFEGFVLIKILEPNDVPFNEPTKLVEIEPYDYTNPNPNKLGKLMP